MLTCLVYFCDDGGDGIADSGDLLEPAFGDEFLRGSGLSVRFSAALA
jgi:hypothetical protein